MEKYSIKYKDFLHENLEDKFSDKISEQYSSLKKGILSLVEDSVKTDELIDIQNYIDKSSVDIDSSNLIGFVDDSDIFDFYFKYQVDIDELCNNNSWFNKTASEENIFSLYNYVIFGSKFAVMQCLKILKKELF